MTAREIPPEIAEFNARRDAVFRNPTLKGAKTLVPEPPTPLLILGQKPDGQPAHVATIADWAPVNPDQWCGEFKRSVVLS